MVDGRAVTVLGRVVVVDPVLGRVVTVLGREVTVLGREGDVVVPVLGRVVTVLGRLCVCGATLRASVRDCVREPIEVALPLRTLLWRLGATVWRLSLLPRLVVAVEGLLLVEGL